MNESRSPSPRDFLRGQALDPSEIEARYPNAKRVLKGGLFISHDGRDFARIRETVVTQVVYDRFMDGYFLHNRMSGGSAEYKELVRTALYYLDKFLLVVSSNSLSNEWVHAEVSLALDLRRPMVLCLLDDSDPGRIHGSLGGVPCVDFRGPLETAQSQLARRLDSMLACSPYERHFW